MNIKFNKVANAERFLPTVDVDVNGRKVLNVVVDSENESSTVNVGYVNEKIEAESGSVFESNGDVAVVEGSVVIGHVGVLVDSHQVGVDDVGNIMIKEAGLYKVDMGLDVSEGFVSGFLELVVSMVNEDDVNTDTVVKKFHLSEGLANFYCKTFNGGEVLKVRITNSDAGSEFQVRTNVIVNKLH